jgi:cobalt ECF transporter T component CbiQ
MRQHVRHVRTSHDFVARSIRSALACLKEAIFAEETAALPGLLQSLDPRVKLAGILLLLLATMFARTLATLGLLYLLCLLLAVASRLRLSFFLVRTWVFIPLFSLAIAIPALFSFVSPGQTIISAGIFHITQHGLRAASFFVGRVVVSVSLAVLLSLSTRHAALLKALRAFAVPQVFVMVLGICYRYIYLFVELIENTYCAIRSRTGARLHHWQGQRIVAWNIGQLWSRSYALNEQVYGAMVSRGFRGEPVSQDRFRTRPRDWMWLGGVAIVCAALMAL